MSVDNKIYVIGHRNPDSDSICSAIGYAHLQQALGKDAIPARAGKVNLETKFILDFFDLPEPLLINDLYPRIKDIMKEPTVKIHPDDTLRELGMAMQELGAKSIAVTDDEGNLVGMSSLGDLAKHYIAELRNDELVLVDVSVDHLLRILEGRLIVGNPERHTISGRVWIAAGRNETIVERLKPGDTVIVSDRPESQIFCLEQGAVCLIVALGAEVDDSVIKLAKTSGALIIKTLLDTYACAKMVNQCIPISSIISTDILSFKPEDLVSEMRPVIARTSYRSYPVLDNNKLVGIVNSDKLIVRDRRQVILVDHNEKSQAVEGVSEASIIEIIDHHRLGGLETSEPIFIRHEPVGCTATIVSNMHWHRDINIPYQIAGILLAAILSDTLIFRSPTCTPADREVAQKLAKITNLDIEGFGRKMLKAGAGLGDLSTAEIVLKDLKEFNIADYRAAITQTYIFDMVEVAPRIDEICKYMDILRQRKNYDMVLMLFTDIIEETSYMAVSGGPEWLISKAFGPMKDEHFYYLPGVVSRKKQIVPPLVKATIN